MNCPICGEPMDHIDGPVPIGADVFRCRNTKDAAHVAAFSKRIAERVELLAVAARLQAEKAAREAEAAAEKGDMT